MIRGSREVWYTAHDETGSHLGTHVPLKFVVQFSNHVAEMIEAVQALIVVIVAFACLRFVWRLARKQKPRPASNRRSQVTRKKPRSLSRKATWIPAGKPVTVKGRTLHDGMVYVGTRLEGVSPYVSVEPALVNPQLQVNNRSPDTTGRDMNYWPSYSDLTPASRAAYLDWLAAGRPAGAYIGYVFLFFYGIERRLLHDLNLAARSTEEIESLILEVERLVSLYGQESSFSSHASEFIAIVKLIRGDIRNIDLDHALARRGWDFPIEFKIGLGSIVDSGMPLPSPWALTWLRLHPETSLRTPAIRCENEFNTLFELRYQERYGPGFTIKRNKTLLNCTYRPASGSFDSSIRINTGDLPDVTKLKRPVRQLQKIAENVTTDLAAYSRWVGRHGDRDSLAALALLPNELIGDRDSEDLSRLKATIDSKLTGKETATIRAHELIAQFPSRKPGVLSTKEAESFSSLLERLGYGIAPDIRYSKVNLSKHTHAAAFRLAAPQSTPTERYLAATVLLQLGAAVGAADGTVTADEEHLLENHLERSLDLPEVDRIRLRAHLQWLLIEPPDLRNLRSRIKSLSHSDRSLIARFVVSVAGADGSISTSEIKVLDRIYNLIGLETEQLHRDIHELGAGPPTQPVTVIRSDETPGYRVPKPAVVDGLSSDRVELDQTRISEVMAATRDVSDLLTSIFEGEVNHPNRDSAAEVVDVEDDIVASKDTDGGLLDHAHSGLMLVLAKRSRWNRSDVEQSAKDLGLMPAGAIETINNLAFELCDEPFIEGDEVLEVNEFALKEMLNVS